MSVLIPMFEQNLAILIYFEPILVVTWSGLCYGVKIGRLRNLSYATAQFFLDLGRIENWNLKTFSICYESGEVCLPSLLSQPT